MFNIVKNQILGHFFVHIRRYCSKSCENNSLVYDSILENAMNKQINRELSASHEYFSLGQHFAQTKIGRYGFGGRNFPLFYIQKCPLKTVFQNFS